MKKNTFKMKAEIILYPSATAAWHMIYLPKKEAKKIREDFGARERGWSSLPVLATIGKTSWRTSIFFDKQNDTYILPLKTEIRKKERLFARDKVKFMLEIRP